MAASGLSHCPALLAMSRNRPSASSAMPRLEAMARGMLVCGVVMASHQPEVFGTSSGP
ncbi:hypothetical protein ACFFX0_32225 [Citricoccus parietis]|uniref:Uncharacterized protein n=1 Tax=Citricoccus parietis TaxID=592307 RepID=A0ABV5G9E2_9MICC